MGTILFCIAGPAQSEGVRVSYLYRLSDFFGTERLSWPRVSADPTGKEIYVTHQSSVRIFDQNGMEVYHFGDDDEQGLGSISDAAADVDGNILVLSHRYAAGQKQYAIIRCDYRGEPQGRVELKGMPDSFGAAFFPDSLVFRNSRLYLCDSAAMKVAVADGQGTIERVVDIRGLMQQPAEANGQALDITGFNVNDQGDLLFTVSVLFRAFRLTPDGVLTGFGQRGSSPGKFNVASGIASDDQGYFYVSDRLKCAILIFDRDFKFVAQVGFRGYDGEGLIVPADLLISGNKLYVTQAASMGVSVFTIEH